MTTGRRRIPQSDLVALWRILALFSPGSSLWGVEKDGCRRAAQTGMADGSMFDGWTRSAFQMREKPSIKIPTPATMEMLISSQSTATACWWCGHSMWGESLGLLGDLKLELCHPSQASPSWSGWRLIIQRRLTSCSLSLSLPLPRAQRGLTLSNLESTLYALYLYRICDI